MATTPSSAPKPGKPGDQPTNVPEPSNTRPPASPTPTQPTKPLTGEGEGDGEDQPEPQEPQDEQDKNEIKGM